jgi:hypothetical protein
MRISTTTPRPLREATFGHLRALNSRCWNMSMASYWLLHQPEWALRRKILYGPIEVFTPQPCRIDVTRVRWKRDGANPKCDEHLVTDLRSREFEVVSGPT